MKKGQGLSMNVIIIAAIALLVLVVLIAIFSGRMGIFSKDLNDNTKKIPCTGDNLEEKPLSDGCDLAIGNYQVAAGNKCCLKS